MRPAPATTLGILLAAAGCAAGEIAPIETSSLLEVGTGEDGFRPLDQGAHLEVVLGPQGGYHVVGNVRVRGFAPAEAFEQRPEGIYFSLVADDGTPLNLDLGATQSSLVRQSDGSWVCTPGHHVLIDGDPAELDGIPARFSARMRTADGEMAIDERVVVLVNTGPAAP